MEFQLHSNPKHHDFHHGKVRINLVEEWFDHIPKLNSSHFNVESNSTPSVVDLRPKMPPIFNQGQLGSCTANALCAIFAYDDPSLIGSRLFLYYNERKMENTVLSDAGACLSDGVEALHTYGICREETWPYSDGDAFKHEPAEHCYAGSSSFGYQMLFLLYFLACRGC